MAARPRSDQASTGIAALDAFRAQLPQAGRTTNAYGQSEAGVSHRHVKAEAKRQMYMQSTEPAPKLRLVGKLLEMCVASPHRLKYRSCAAPTGGGGNIAP